MAQKNPKFSYGKWLKEYELGAKWPDRLTVVAILWTDATKGEDLESSGTLTALTPGVLMRADRHEIVVAHEVFNDKGVRDVTTVPRKMVKDILLFGTIEL